MSLSSKLNAWIKSPQGQSRLQNKLEEYNRNGVKKTAAGDSVIPETRIYEAAAKFIQVLQMTAKSYDLPDSVIIKEMYANSQAHHTASKEEKARLDKRNLTLGAMLGQYGVNAYRQNGTWYVDGGALLYEKYRKYIYHTGGIAGDQPTLKQNEILAVLEKGEAVLDAKKEAGLYRIIDFTTALSDKLSKLLTLTDMSRMFGQMQGDVTKAASAFAPINNTQAPSVSFGDVIIYGANEETVEKHREINRQFTNDVIKQLNIKR